MIEARGLVKSFEGFRALDGLTLTAPKGAVYGLVGPNGAGKSTFIRHLAGIYRQEEGELLVEGEPVFENPAVKAKIAYIPDDIFFYTQASIRDMARFVQSLYPSFDAERYEKLSALFGLDDKRPMRKLSKGQQKQAAFQIAMSQRPELVVLDEPVDGLDPVMRRQVWSVLLSDVEQYGTTVLVSSHNLRELEDVCDHVGIMNHGRMLVERSLSELQENLVKLQLAYPDGGALPEGLEIVHESATGRLRQLILRGTAAELTEKIAATQPLFMDFVPLTLEEIFIYELGGADYEVKNLVL
ncbi:MAG: ABC transporter ATP-binding protein [Oscillospiraceae bacterium]|nr:ABC transporter ATP-binding protein [Oscillospiraceae bacterium]